MKQLGVILLSVIFLYAGPAWALKGCWGPEGHAERLVSELHHHSHFSFHHSHPTGNSFSPTHCCSHAKQLPALTKPAAAQLERPMDRLVLFRIDFIVLELARLLTRTAMASSLRHLPLSYQPGIPHHLFLSILHI